MLPPTRTTLMPNIVRTNFICMRDKSYISPNPYLPPLEENGWLLHEGVYIPLKYLCPAPRAVIELVKCGCQTLCKGTCSCAKNKLSCTPLCKVFYLVVTNSLTTECKTMRMTMTYKILWRVPWEQAMIDLAYCYIFLSLHSR